MQNDLVNISIWWLVFFLIGFISLPLCFVFFKKFTDLGYGFSKQIGFLFITYFTFLMAILRLTPFDKFLIFTGITILLLLNLTIFFIHKEMVILKIKSSLKTIILQEILFTFGLILWSLIRSYNPDINGLEKFMDYGFINTILRSDHLPPVDMWFTGKSINYYWFGHLWVAVATKISGIPSGVTYNLMLATILGLTLMGAFSISSTLIKNLNPKGVKKIIFAAGIISAITLSFASNFHTPIYAIKDGRDKYWYPDATRFIGYNPETNDKTIHEFPIYSFVVSDLHPHLINLPSVLLFIGVFLSFFIQKRQKILKIITLGFLLGIFFVSNTWDFGNYMLFSGFSFLLFNLKKYGFSLKALLNTSISTAIVIVIGITVATPFIFNFESIAQGIQFVKSRSLIWQLAILWGFPGILTLFFILTLLKEKVSLKKIKNSDLFTLSLLLSAWVLIIIPEIIYVKDIYIASHHRANTMFKLTYQAFVMTYLASGYIAIRILRSIKTIPFKIALLSFLAVIFGSILSYPSFSVKSYYQKLENYKGLSGESWLEKSHPDTYKTIVWFIENVKNQPTILEAPGDSYTEFNVISAYTGLPTVSGWFVHEWLWRGDSKFPQARVADIDQIYTSKDIELTKSLLKKYGVKYVIIGQFERQKYQNIYEEKFTKFGKEVFSSNTTRVYKI